MICLKTELWKESLYSDSQRFHQYQQNEKWFIGVKCRFENKIIDMQCIILVGSFVKLLMMEKFSFYLGLMNPW